MKRIAVAALAIGALVLPAVAQAHISLHPNTIPAGAFVTLDVRVPGEQEGAYAGDRSKLGRLENGNFIQFPLSIAMPGNIAGQSLAFKTIQYYSNGKVIHWIGSPSAEYPAPTVNITAKGGVIEDVAGGEAGPTAGETPTGGASTATSSGSSTTAGSSGGASKGLAITALVLGALGLMAGVGGLFIARQARRAT
jgi:hypothetical protein